MDENISTSQLNRIKQKSTWFVGTTHKLQNIENIKRNISEFNFYAYILHDKDEGKSLHIHFVGQVNGTRSIKSIAEMLECDYQDIQACKRPRGSIRYLTHLDDKDKYQYDYNDIVCSNSDRLDFYLKDMTNSINDVYADYVRLHLGQMTAKEFIEKYNAEFASLPFYQKIKTLEVIHKISMYA